MRISDWSSDVCSSDLNDQFQVGAPGQQLPQEAQQKIDVQAALVGFVDDNGVVALQQRISLRFGQQYAVGHQLNGRVRSGTVIKAYLIAHPIAQFRLMLRTEEQPSELHSLMRIT